MSIWYIDLAAGSDAAAGTSDAPFLTPDHLESVWTGGDVAYIRATGYPAGVLDDIIDNASVFQWPGEAQAEWRGSSAALNPGTWVDVGAGVYTYPIASGLGAGAVGAILFNYYSQQNMQGSHFGALKLSASAAAVAIDGAAAPTKGFFFYQTATGLITAYFGGDNPGFGVTHYVARDTTIFIELTGTGNVVDGIHFKAGHQANQGAFVWHKDGSGSSRIANCYGWDGSNHAFICSGQSVLMTNAVIENCRSYGLAGPGAHFTFYQTNGLGNISGCSFIGCHAVRNTYLGIDEEPLAACTQTGWYSHASAGTCMRGIVHVNCTSYDVQNSSGAICAVGSAPDATANTWAGHYNHAINCEFQNMPHYRNSDGSMAFARCIFGLQQAGPSGLNTYGQLGTVCASRNSGGGLLYFEACPMIHDFTGGAGASVIGFHAEYATSEIRCVNCPIYDISTDSPNPVGQVHMATFSATATAAMAFIGCIFSFKTNRGSTNEQRLFYSDGSTALTLSDCAYGLIPDGVGHPSAGAITGATAATLTPVGARDANPNVIGADPFTSATNLRISPSSALYGDLRATSTVVPATLIGGSYDGSFGAYALSTGGGGGLSGGAELARHTYHRRHQLTRHARR